MKSRTLTCITAITLFAALATPVQLAAQGQATHFRHYKLIDMGTLGGPRSYFNSLNLTDVFGFGTVFYNLAQVRNPQGVFVGFADTIDLCINNAIIGVQEQNTYAQTEGERRPARRSAEASLGIAGFWLLS